MPQVQVSKQMHERAELQRLSKVAKRLQKKQIERTG
nr:MAG TPA: hypothetical protein [Caudoviricetes sp.]